MSCSGSRPSRPSRCSNVAGRFVLVSGTAEEHDFYCTSWDTWEECEVAFPMEDGCWLIDGETGREWGPGSKYEREAPRA